MRMCDLNFESKKDSVKSITAFHAVFYLCNAHNSIFYCCFQITSLCGVSKLLPLFITIFLLFFYYIIPIPGFAGIAGVSSFMVATTDSVVRSVEATLVAFCNALLVTFAGSRIPASTIDTYSSL